MIRRALVVAIASVALAEISLSIYRVHQIHVLERDIERKLATLDSLTTVYSQLIHGSTR